MNVDELTLGELKQSAADFELRWPGGVVACPYCGSAKIVPTLALPLKSWLLAVWMISNCKNGISSYELARALGVTQKTGWFMLHRIRTAMQANGGGTLGGEVEVDETYIGGKARNMHPARREKMRGRTWAGKVAVMGLLQRHPGKGKSKVRIQRHPGKGKSKVRIQRHPGKGKSKVRR